MARTRLETILWAKLGFTPTADALEGFLAEFPDGARAAEAAKSLAKLKAETEKPRTATPPFSALTRHPHRWYLLAAATSRGLLDGGQDLHQLSRGDRRNAVRLTHERFRPDAQGLVKQLEKALLDADAARQAAATAAEEDAKRRVTEEAAKGAEAARQEKET